VLETEAKRELHRFDFAAQKRIVRYLDTRVLGGDPRRFGKPPRGDRHGLWRWRVDDPPDYRANPQPGAAHPHCPCRTPVHGLRQLTTRGSEQGSKPPNWCPLF
jgi:hypothetical protein